MSELRRFLSVDPATEEQFGEFPADTPDQIDSILDEAFQEQHRWSRTPLRARGQLLLRAAQLLRDRKQEWALIITREMGKPLAEAAAEIEKCAWNCEYYAQAGDSFLLPRHYPSEKESYVQHLPLGVVLAIMPWNFPFWQVIRFAAPALLAGNTAVLKHASNVPQCALALQQIFHEAGFPQGCFRTLLVSGKEASEVIADRRIAAATLTGSEQAGAAVAAAAGRALKKVVLELGGSDPFIVLEDADVAKAVQVGVQARFLNTGQSCIAAKRFLVVEAVYEEFEAAFVRATGSLKMGNPQEPGVQVGPLARADLRRDLEAQVEQSVAQGARVLTGGVRPSGRGYFYPPTVLVDVESSMPAGCQELFGPVAALFRVRNAEHALQIANESPYGLGCSLWTSDLERARRMAGQIETGQVFVNQMVASDPRLPFGGVKKSGYGRELSDLGIREFVNVQTVSIDG